MLVRDTTQRNHRQEACISHKWMPIHSIWWALMPNTFPSWPIPKGQKEWILDALSSPNQTLDQNISTLISNIRSLSDCFLSFKFCWVRRNCHAAGHLIASPALNSNQSFCFNKRNLPHPSIKAICKGDSLVYSSVSV